MAYTDPGMIRQPRPDAWASDCGRYFVERVDASKYELYGPVGLIEAINDAVDTIEAGCIVADRNPRAGEKTSVNEKARWQLRLSTGR